MPGVASSMPITAVKTMSDTTRGLVSARKDLARPSGARLADLPRDCVDKTEKF